MNASMEREIELVTRAQEALTRLGPFVSLASAARETGIPLPTLSDAVRNGRIPALKVQNRRWLVRLAAVRLYFGRAQPASPDEAEQRLVSRGVASLPSSRSLDPRAYRARRLARVKGKAVSQTISEDRD
jgi:hypothetical protein